MFIKHHTSPEQLLFQVKALFEQGHLHEAHHVIECIIENGNPLIASADLFALHAKIYVELFGFNVHAQCAIQQSLMLDPSNEEALALQKLSAVHEELRDGLYETGTAKLETLLAAEPGNAYAMYLLANQLFWKNGPETKAIALFEKSVKLRPSFLKSWLGLAMAYKKNQESAKAEDAFQECLALDINLLNQEFYKKHLQSL